MKVAKRKTQIVPRDALFWNGRNREYPSETTPSQAPAQ